MMDCRILQAQVRQEFTQTSKLDKEWMGVYCYSKTLCLLVQIAAALCGVNDERALKCEQKKLAQPWLA